MPKTSETKTFTPTIASNIPLPPIVRSKSREKSDGLRIMWPLAEMHVGDSVLVPSWAGPKRAFASLRRAQRDARLPRSYRITMRTTAEGVRFWRVA